MLTPSGVTLAQYLTAVRADKPSHVKITFIGQGIVLEDEDIESLGIKVNHFLNGDTDLIFGRAVMANITIPILNSNKIANLNWNGEFKFEIGQEINNNTTEWITIGYFTGSRPDKVNTVNVIEFTANDRMNKFDRLADDWIASLTYPITVQGMFQSLCTHCGVGYVSGNELPNIFARSYSESPFKLEGQSCRDILGQIAEACGCYARITNSGSVKLVWFTDHTADYTLTEDYEYPPVETFDVYGKKWKDVASLKWSGLGSDTWGNLAGNLSAFKINSLYVVDSFANMATIVPTVKRSGNVYTIIDNPFLSYANNTEKTAYITPIYNRLAAFDYYVPMKVACVGCALIEAGDIIEVVVNGSTINMPIFCIQTVWNGSITDEYETTGQLNRAEVNVENMVKLSESARYVLTMEQIRLIAQGKYDIQSGVAITPEGITVSGSSYVNIESGGQFNVDSTDFTVNSEDKYIQIGDTVVDANGLRYIFDDLLPNGKHAFMSLYKYEETLYGSLCKSFVFTLEQKNKNNNNLTDSFNLKFLLETGETYSGTDPNKKYGSYSIIPWVPGTNGTYLGSIGNAANSFARGYFYNLYCESTFYCNGDGDFTGVVECDHVVQTSSKDEKHDITELPEVSKTIDQLKPVSFVYNKDEKERKRFGLIYEDTIDVLPEVCIETENGTKGIDYVALVPLLLKEIQDLRKRVSELERRE